MRNLSDNAALQIHPQLLHALLTQAGSPASIHALAQATQLSIEQTQRELARLVSAGCALDHHPQLGVTLQSADCATWVDYLQWHLGTQRQIMVYRQTPSTQDAARRLLLQQMHTAHGGVVIADQQYAGRGRLGRTWLATPGSAVTFSLLHVADARKNITQAMSMDRLIFATAVAVARGIEAAASTTIHAQIKWPNDVLIQGRKIAGILVETLTLSSGQNAAIIGVGINVGATPDLAQVDPDRGPRIATSLADHCPHAQRLVVMQHVIKAMDNALSMHDPSALVEDWRARSVLLTQAIKLQTPQGIVQGDVIDLDPYEGLIVRTADGAILHLPAATTSVV